MKTEGARTQKTSCCCPWWMFSLRRPYGKDRRGGNMVLLSSSAGQDKCQVSMDSEIRKEDNKSAVAESNMLQNRV